VRIYLIADTHLNHGNIATYCQRPENFTEIIIQNWRQTVQPSDHVIHLGDVFIGKPEGWDAIHPLLPGKKTLIRGNHDRKRSVSWWMDHGFDFACDAMMFRGHWLTHEPAPRLPYASQNYKDSPVLNIHGHLHNIWHGFHRGTPSGSTENFTFMHKRLQNPWQRLFAIEYTQYRPVEFEKFVSHPDKYQSRGPVNENTET
jgi:calcineurin-like phosphoesterase family protein